MNRRWIVLALAAVVLPSCGQSCQGSADQVGIADVGVFVECDRASYTVHNRDEQDRYVTISSFCVLNTAQIPPLGKNGKLPDIVVHGSGVTNTPPFNETLPKGSSKRIEIDLAKVDNCDDYTDAPPGQHERGPTSLVSNGPADGLMMHLSVSSVSAMRTERNARVVCKW
ncbi:MAG: hypothetical protein JRF63_02525 [Deltaproteobacteria bacterium]|nr:hypothetical protein [Deltaproteobacteria bacterium]